MHTFKCLLLPFLLALNFWLATSSILQDAYVSTSICDKLKIQTPFSKPNSPTLSPLNRMVICKSRKSYHSNRTSANLFPISSTNYKFTTLTISQPSCSSSLHYIPPKLLSAGLSNSLLLHNCSNIKFPSSPTFHNLTCLSTCGASSNIQEPELKGLTLSSCFLVDDFTKLDMGFHPNDLNCSCYSRVYRKPSGGIYAGYELRTRMSFDIPDHVPNICDECQKPKGNCGAGLRCICHPKECKNKVISKGGSINRLGNMLVSLLTLVVVTVLAVNP